MAYRLIGLAGRMCLEMGLHRQDAVMKAFTSEEEVRSVNRLFWSVYSLDRRWSFGTGLPFVIQDEDIDPALPDPVSDQTNQAIWRSSSFPPASIFFPLLIALGD